MKKFSESDIFVNVIKANPKVGFFCYNGKIYVNNTINQEIYLNDFFQQPSGEGVALDNVVLTEDGNFLITESGDYILIE